MAIDFPQGPMTDSDFSEFARKHGLTDDELIRMLIDQGWTIGRTEDERQNEYWPPSELNCTG